MPGVPILLGPVSMGLSARSGGDGCREQPAAPGPSLASWLCRVGAALCCIPVFYPFFLDAVVKAASRQLGLPATPASCTGSLL